MGESLISFYRVKLTKEQKFTFYSALIISLMIHIYKFVNTLPNHDSVYNYYADQNILGSGRWALSLSCGISSYYDLPWINGLLSCFWLALTIVVIVMLFKIKNRVLILLTGGLIASAPAITETFFFLYTADGYLLAMLLAALSAYFSRIEEKRLSLHILSAVCICITCAIYQAYVTFALLLSVFCFIMELLENKHRKQEYFRWILRQVLIYVSALVAYYVIWQVLLAVTGTAVNKYQGIDKLGHAGFSSILFGLTESVKIILLYFLQWNVLTHGFSLYSILNILLMCLLAAELIFSVCRSGILHRKWQLALLILSLLAVIPFSCIWIFISPEVEYRPMMLTGLALIPVFAGILYERWGSMPAKNAVCILLMLITFNSTIVTNICYFHMEMCKQRTYADGIEMVSEIHDLQDDYQFSKLVVLGNRYTEVPWPVENDGRYFSRSNHLLTRLIDRNILNNPEHVRFYLKGTFDVDLPLVYGEEAARIRDMEIVQEMPCWPADGSMIVVEDVLVLKLSDDN